MLSGKNAKIMKMEDLDYLIHLKFRYFQKYFFQIGDIIYETY